jgi:prevent-host-death family protein
MTIVPLAEAKAGLSELVKQVKDTHDRVEITVHGKPAAVLISHADLDSLLETLDILSDAETVKRLSQAKVDIARGELYSAEEVFADLQARRGRSSE